MNKNTPIKKALPSRRALLKSSGNYALISSLFIQTNVFAQEINYGKAINEDASEVKHINDQKLYYNSPAKEWVEALPIGNGRLAAMVFGGVSTDRLQFNECNFFSGGPYFPVNPKAKSSLPKIRELVFNGKYTEAEALINSDFFADLRRQSSYQPIGDLLILSPGIDNSRDYRRELDLTNAIATTSFNAAKQYKRETFASEIDDVIITKLSSDYPKGINAEFIISSPQTASLSILDNDTIILRGENPNHDKYSGALKFELRVKIIQTGGKAKTTGNSILVTGAESVVIYTSIATNFVDYKTLTADPISINKELIAKAVIKGFDNIKADHIKTYQSKYNRLQIDLGKTAQAELPTNIRIAEFNSTPDPDLCALYVQYGRYLLLSSSRKGGQPANLQGIWNDKTNPPWGSKWTININTEMNYWISGVGNIIETIEPLFEMVEDLSLTGEKFAKEVYGARGWVAHHNTDLWRVPMPTDGAKWGMWAMGGAWLLQNLWDIYEFNPNNDYLMRLYPLMKGASLFFLDTLQKDPKSGFMVTNPSISPENNHGFGTSICAGPAMDNQILRDLFSRTILASKLLNQDKSLSKELANMMSKLPPDKIGKSGQLQEWQEDWDDGAPDQQHRHVSHLYGLYPSEQITLDKTPALANAAKKTLLVRGDDTTGWAIGWRINLWARLKDGNQTLSVIKRLLSPKRSYNNLFDAHPPFQIDGNFGGASGILEMLMQSHSGIIEFLPALPSEWKNGKIKGMLARGGFEVSFEWENNKIKQAIIKSKLNTKIKVKYNNNIQNLIFKAGETKTIQA